MAGSGSTASAGTSSGAEGGSGGATVAEPVCDAVTRVLIAKCGGGSCHSNENSNIGAFARGREEAESMLDKPSSKLGCGFIIDSSNPADSLLLTKVNGTFPDPCGGPMPAPAAGETTELSAGDIDCLEDWLQQFQQ